jgi:hypothetical protein
MCTIRSMRFVRTNIEIDLDLCQLVMTRYGLTSKRDAVNAALRHLADQPPSRCEEDLAFISVLRERFGHRPDFDELVRRGLALREWAEREAGEPLAEPAAGTSDDLIAMLGTTREELAAAARADLGRSG